MNKKIVLITFIILSLFKVNAQNENLLEWANQGSVTQNNYLTEIPFNYIDGYMFIDILQNNKSYNFIFDTGAEATVIDKSIMNEFKFKHSEKSTISGPVVTNQSIQTIVLKNITISEIEFVNIGAVAVDLKFPKKRFCNKVHGIIGTTLIKKANWQIDYQNKKIRFTNKLSKLNLTGNEHKIKMDLNEKGWGTETVELNIDGYSSSFNVDTGNGRSKIVAHPDKFKKLLKKNKGTSVKYGVSKSDTDYRIITKKISIGGITLENQTLSLENEVGNRQLLGNRFLENYLVTIDWKNHFLYLNQKRDIIADTLVDFELNFSPNFKTNTIEMLTGLKKFTSKNKIEKGTILSKINDKNLIGLSDKEFCEFWTTSWDDIIKEDTINVVLIQNGKNKEYALKRKELLSI